MSDEDVVDVQGQFKDGGQPPPPSGPSDDRMDTLKTLGWISYSLHLAVAISAVIPGVQAGVGLLFVAILIDWIKKQDAQEPGSSAIFPGASARSSGQACCIR